MKGFSAFDAYFKTQTELWQAGRLTGVRFKLCYVCFVFFFKYSFTNKSLKESWTLERSHKLVIQGRSENRGRYDHV